MREFYMDTSVGKVHCCRWEPQGEIKGIIQIIHGIQEYVGRYSVMANFFAEQGFVVVGADHPGHGLSVTEENGLGYLAGGWKEAVKNIHKLCVNVRKEFPSLPYFMFGHSMGSFLLTTYLTLYHDGITGAVISGTGWQAPALVSAGCTLCKIEKRRFGEAGRSKLLLDLMFGPYIKRFEPARTPYDWICSDNGVVDVYAADPLCTWKPTVQLCEQMLRGIQRNQKEKYLSQMDTDLPVFFIAGQQDPVGDFGNGVLRAVAAFRRVGMKDVLVELYPDMRHECHNECGKDRVYQDVLRWFEDRSKTCGGV